MENRRLERIGYGLLAGLALVLAASLLWPGAELRGLLRLVGVGILLLDAACFVLASRARRGTLGGGAPESPVQRGYRRCQRAWTAVQVLLVSTTGVVLLGEQLPPLLYGLLLIVVPLTAGIVFWKLCRCPVCGGHLMGEGERKSAVSTLCPHCGAELNR